MPERRTVAKLICFHPDELARITERARVCGQTPARFIRETALGAITATLEGHWARVRQLAQDGRRSTGAISR